MRSSSDFPSPRRARTCWWHTDRPLEQDPPNRLRRWVEKGGRLLLSLEAVEAAYRLGLDAAPPNERLTGVWRATDDQLWADKEFRAWRHRRGFAGFGPHPLFDGFTGGGPGVYVWEPTEGERFVARAYLDARPAGRVVACERAYLQVNPRRVVAWEYRLDQGGVLCLGAFLYFLAADRSLRMHLELLVRNALFGAAIPHVERPPAACWPEPGTTARRDPSLLLPDAPALGGVSPAGDDRLAVASRVLEDRPWDLAGRRIVALGGEQAGLSEVWCHPHRVLKDLAVRVAGENPLARDAMVGPDAVVRHLVTRYRTVEETMLVALEHPVAVIEYRLERLDEGGQSHAAPDLELGWEMDLRRMWPYPEGVWGDLRFYHDDRVLLVADSEERALGAVIASRPVRMSTEPVAGRPALSCRLSTTLEEPLRLALFGAAGRRDLDRAVRAFARRTVDGLARERTQRARERSHRWTAVRCPDPGFERAFEWAKARLDGFLVDTPGVGRSLVAGYGPSRTGWEHGRPGYGWYFGRDACWAAPALLAGGEWAAVRHTLRFLLGAADVTGKIPHEMTTSGLAHYDAADSTPLVLWLAARYAAWTGDLEFLVGCWPALERAYRFCVGTDTDGDGLIENLGVGHGWIESGPLAGARMTLYLAAVWEAALRELAPAARALGHGSLADELTDRAGAARRAITRRFRTGDGYAFGIAADGSRRLDRTALLAVPLYLGAVDGAPAAPWFEWVASPDATAPWGVRLVGRSHPQYRPRGYHRGAVWPLFTGWVALAEYRWHRAAAGFQHLRMNADLPFAHGVGQFAEVLDGENGSEAGVCPDQAWSAAMLVTPLIEGLLGLRPDALNRSVALRPHLPPAWDRLEIRNLRVGQSSFDLRLIQRAGHLDVAFRRTGGPPLAVTLDPAVPAGSDGTEAAVDDAAVRPRLSGDGACRHAAVDLELRAEHVVRFAYAGIGRGGSVPLEVGE